MNNTFEWQRFCQVVKKDFRSLWNLYGITMLIITLVPIALWILVALFSDAELPTAARGWEIYVLVALATIMAPSRLYRTANLQNQGIYFAMLPASKLEKFLSMLLYTIIVCPVLVLAGSIVLDTLLTLLPFGPYRHYLWELYPASTEVEIWDDMPVWFGINFALGCIVTPITFLFTNTIFKKHKVTKTILWLMLINFVATLFILPAVLSGVNEESFMARDFIENYNYIGLVWNLILIAGLLVWTWLRMKKMPY